MSSSHISGLSPNSNLHGLKLRFMGDLSSTPNDNEFCWLSELGEGAVFTLKTVHGVAFDWLFILFSLIGENRES